MDSAAATITDAAMVALTDAVQWWKPWSHAEVWLTAEFTMCSIDIHSN